MSVGVYSVCLLSCVGIGLAVGWSPVQGVRPGVCKVQISQLPNSRRARAREPNPPGQNTESTVKADQAQSICELQRPHVFMLPLSTVSI
jgi:hypothetical protein